MRFCETEKKSYLCIAFSGKRYSLISENNMTNEAKQLWSRCLGFIKNNVDPNQYDAWFAPLAFYSYNKETNTLKLQAPSSFVLEYIEEHFISLLCKALTRYYGTDIKLEYRVLTSNTEVNQSAKEDVHIDDTHKETGLNSSPTIIEAYTDLDSQLDTTRTFNNFIAGNSNKLPRAVGLSIAENYNKTQFNPFFIFGPSGCGKTHLINAIGIKMKQQDPKARVLYISARLFQVQFTDAVRHNTFNDFITFYQTIDTLIIDDVQEWITAPKTQEAFFHIFNHLFRNGKRIILACDRPPVDLRGMSDRLLTRLKCGLVAELERPDVQLCIDVLKSKVEQNGLKVPAEVIDYIANTANGSIRDLEGILNNLMASAFVFNKDIDIDMAQKAVRSIVKTKKLDLTIDDILEKVCDYYQISEEEISGKSRKQNLVIARQVAMYLTDKHTEISRSYIGRRIANRDHTTVIHSCTKIAELIKSDKAFSDSIRAIENSLLLQA